MKLWDKIKAWNYKKTHQTCPWCKVEQHKGQFCFLWLPDNQCNDCYWKEHHRQIDIQKNKEREARINEMAEAIRRASPIECKPWNLNK